MLNQIVFEHVLIVRIWKFWHYNHFCRKRHKLLLHASRLKSALRSFKYASSTKNLKLMYIINDQLFSRNLISYLRISIFISSTKNWMIFLIARVWSCPGCVIINIAISSAWTSLNASTKCWHNFFFSSEVSSYWMMSATDLKSSVNA